MDNRTISEIRRNETKLINEMKALEQENQELKKQLKNYVARISCDGKCEICEYYKKAYLSETQQKEFIKYLEDEIEKYKEIIGNNSDVTR